MARIKTRLPSSFSPLPPAACVAAGPRRSPDRRPQRVDVDVRRDLDLEDVAVDVLGHDRRARHERGRAIVDRVIGRAVVTVAGGAERAGHLPDRRAQGAVDRLRPRHRAIAADDDRVPFGRDRRAPRFGANREQREGEDGGQCGEQRSGASHAP